MAIIAQALEDALAADAELIADAVAYLTGGAMCDHLWAVGLNPAYVLPALVDQVLGVLPVITPSVVVRHKTPSVGIEKNIQRGRGS